ncbi:MAG: OprO/OprP family phosphate-selective porin [Bacteroides sp.]|nr:OprO/OprP family phosphate-selective porin [Bacteroides sp.]
MKKTILVGLAIFASYTAYTQENAGTLQTEDRLSAIEQKLEKMGELKFSGYVQTQWTWNEANISSGDQNDFTIRRGRLKADYKNKYGQAVLQVDVTEDGVNIKDAYLKIPIPKADWLAVRAGVFDRPFGYEISYSSSRRESPERSRIFQTLFPKERDLGAEIVVTGPEDTFFKDFALNAGIFAGNGGQAKETDSGKDFIGHLAYTKELKNISFGLGASLYYGGVRLAGEETQKAYHLKGKEFVEDASLTPGEYADRHYFGFDGQFSFKTPIGNTQLRGEYLWGTQPGASGGSKSPTGKITADIYCRDFQGYYVQLVQNLGTTPHAFVAKWDSYDPNTKLSKDECLTVGDIAYNTLGLGCLFQLNKQLRLIAYYELNYNEKVKNDRMVAQYNKDLNDDVFTLRVQYKF